MKGKYKGVTYAAPAYEADKLTMLKLRHNEPKKHILRKLVVHLFNLPVEEQKEILNNTKLED